MLAQILSVIASDDNGDADLGPFENVSFERGTGISLFAITITSKTPSRQSQAPVQDVLRQDDGYPPWKMPPSGIDSLSQVEGPDALAKALTFPAAENIKDYKRLLEKPGLSPLFLNPIFGIKIGIPKAISLIEDIPILTNKPSVKIPVPVTSLIRHVPVAPNHPLADFSLLKRLGAGAHGSVSLAQHRPSGTLVAIKTIPKIPHNLRAFMIDDEDDEEFDESDITDMSASMMALSPAARHAAKYRSTLVFQEFLAHRRVSSERHVAELLGATHDSLNWYLLLKFYSGGDLQDYLDHYGVLPRELVPILMATLVVSLKALHQHGVAHRDIKPANILMDDNQRFILADLGGSRLFWKNVSQEERTRRQLSVEQVQDLEESETGEVNQFAGTPDFMAPEVWLEYDSYNIAADIWSAGMVGWNALVGRLPWEPEYFSAPAPSDTLATNAATDACEDPEGFNGFTIHSIARDDPGLFHAAKQIHTAPIAFTDTEREQCKIDEITEDFFLRMVDRNQYTRPKASELEAHPFFANFDWDNLLSTNTPACSKPEDTVYASSTSEDDDEPLIEMGCPYGPENPDTAPHFQFLSPILAGPCSFPSTTPPMSANDPPPSPPGTSSDALDHGLIPAFSASSRSLSYRDESPLPDNSLAITLVGSPHLPDSTFAHSDAETSGCLGWDTLDATRLQEDLDLPLSVEIKTSQPDVLASWDMSLSDDGSDAPPLHATTEAETSTSVTVLDSFETKTLQPIDDIAPSESSCVLLSLDSILIVDDLLDTEDNSDVTSSECPESEDDSDMSPNSIKADSPRPTGVFTTLRTWATSVWHRIKSWVGWD
ncbi:hypothetical protein NLI96_g6838 [Meripilus lineatus]|uniref:non-specific serine/threonine protein kinase n=1 Tax=Meripilus lineatus TaxID=2056292 RepID=A0AAD5V2J2_9APHY|nr:hypothetical protein NLI96_g6838 [Physisporinus lineatus]